MFRNWKCYILVIIVLGLFIPLLYSFGFISDDFWLIYTCLKNPFPLTGDWAFTTNRMFRPLTMLTFRLNYMLAGITPFTFYLTNLLIHILNTYVIFRILGLLNPDDEVQKCRQNLLLSFFFFIVPQNLHNVFWISGRTDLLCGLFVFSSVYFLIRFFNEGNNKYLFFSFCAQVLAFMSKESALIILFYIPLLLIIRREYLQNVIKNWRSSILLLLPTVIYIQYRLIIFPEFPFGATIRVYHSFYEVFQFYIYGLWSLFIPFAIDDGAYFKKTNILLLFLLIIIILVIIFTCLYLYLIGRKESKFKQLPLIFILISVSLGIYFKTTPEMRLAYPFSLLILSFFFILLNKSAVSGKSIIISGLLLLTFAGDFCLVYRNITISQYYKRVNASLPDSIDKNMNYYVITPLLMLGQNFARPEAGLMTQFKLNHDLDYAPKNFFNAGEYNGASLSNPVRDLSVSILSRDSVLVSVKSNYDFILPDPPTFFSPSGEYVYPNMNMRIIPLTRMYKGERLSSCLIVLTKPENSKVIIIQ